MRTKSLSLLGLLVAVSMILGACGQGPETIIVTQEVGGEIVEVVVTATPEEMAEPITLNYNLSTEPPTADPALTTDTTSVAVTGNIFMGLTVLDQITSEVKPWLATDWSVSDDGLVWTFNMRDDIPWVRYNCSTGEVDFELDADGNVRYVNAYDVEYGTKRTVDPATASDYSYVLYAVKNAQAVNHGDEGFTVDDIGVKALDDYTVEFTLEAPAPYFGSIASMWIAYPVPQWTIELAGDKWTEPCTIVTNGPYVMTEWVHGSFMQLKKNPHWPMADMVQIEQIDAEMIVESSTAFAMYENGELDTTGVPLPEIDRVKADPVLSEEFYQAPVACTYYYGYTNNKPPMDDVRVRMAFSMSVDKQSLVDNVTRGGQIPAGHFAPQGIFGAPEIGSVGLAYDPAAAKALLDEYLAETGQTVDDLDITLMHNTSEGHAAIAAAIQQMWADNLGVTVSVENQEWTVYLQTIQNDTPIDEMPHIWRLGWCADYADQNNWVHEVFNADAGANRLRRGCPLNDVCDEVTLSKFDELTDAARLEQDPAKRVELYFEAEKELSEVEAAYIPIYFYTTVAVTKPYLDRTYPSVAPLAFYEWTIDWDAKSGE